MMIMRIIRDGSSERSSNSVILAEKMSFARENTGPEKKADNAATGRDRSKETGRSARPRSGVRISSSGIGADAGLIERHHGRTHRCSDCDRAQQQGTDGCDQGRDDLRLTEHWNSPFFTPGF